jgi:hypothetical protein
MKAICASENLDLFMVLSRPTARISHAAKLEFSSKNRSSKPGAGQGDSRPGLVGPSGIKGFVPMTAAPSVAIATVAALLVYSFGRAIRSPLRRWRRRRQN